MADHHSWPIVVGGLAVVLLVSWALTYLVMCTFCSRVEL
jgi:hypothetical protein